MRFFVLFLLWFSYELRANEKLLIATTENDPSVLIEGTVNAITQQPCIVEEDLVVQGIEPIRIVRSYSGGCVWNTSHCFILAKEDKESPRIWTGWENGYPIAYRDGEWVSIGEECFLRCNCINHERGFANTYRGERSSRTNLKNNYLLLTRDERFLFVHAAQGTIRRYKKSQHAKRRALYRLLDEHLPNGNWILYEYLKQKKDDEEFYALSSIRTMNPSKTKMYAHVDLIYHDFWNSNTFTLKGSDGQELTYHYAHIKHLPKEEYSFADRSGPLIQITSPSNIDQKFSYFWVHWSFLGQKLMEYSDAQDRLWQFVHSPSKEEIFGLNIAVKNEKYWQPLHTFTGEWIDREGNKTRYLSDGSYRPLKIERYSKENLLYKTELFVWGQGRDLGNLIAKTTLDIHGSPIASLYSVYDERGNVLEEHSYENYLGTQSPLIFDEHNLPIQPDSRHRIKRFRYSEGEPSLLLEEQEASKRVLYEYLPGTDLVASRSLYDGETLQIRTMFLYNEDHVLIRTEEEVGGSSQETKENVTLFGTLSQQDTETT